MMSQQLLLYFLIYFLNLIFTPHDSAAAIILISENFDDFLQGYSWRNAHCVLLVAFLKLFTRPVI